MVKLFKIKYIILKFLVLLKSLYLPLLRIGSIIIIFLIIAPFFQPVFSANETATVSATDKTEDYVPSNLGDWVGIEGECNNNTPGYTNPKPIVTEDSGSGNSKFVGVMMASITNRILGCSYLKQGAKKAENSQRIVLGGALSVGENALGSLYATPTSSLAYQLNQTISMISPVKNAEAQSLSGAPTGASILQFVKTLHSSVTNIVYVVYVFVFIIIAITILLRKKINGQESVNIMNFIPRIIISLILVVFSYSISGLIIDVSNIGMGVVYDIFVNQVENYNGVKVSAKFPSLVAQNLQPSHPDMSVFRIFGTSQGNGNINVNVNFVTPNFGSSNQLVTTLANAINVIAGQGASGLSGLIGLILAVGALSSMFKIFFSLLKDFLTLLFYPILAPIQFALIVFPGQEKGAIEWFKTMLGSSLSFIAMYAVFFLIFLLGQNFFNDGAPLANQIWNPPLLGFNQTPTAGFVSYLAAYGLYVISAGIPDMVKGALKLEGGVFGKVGAQLSQTTKSAASKVTLGLLK